MNTEGRKVVASKLAEKMEFANDNPNGMGVNHLVDNGEYGLAVDAGGETGLNEVYGRGNRDRLLGPRRADDQVRFN